MEGVFRGAASEFQPRLAETGDTFRVVGRNFVAILGLPHDIVKKRDVLWASLAVAGLLSHLVRLVLRYSHQKTLCNGACKEYELEGQ